MSPPSSPIATRISQSGYTLIELLVVLAIIGVMAGLLPMAVSVGRPTAELRSTAFKLAHAFRTARQEAILTGVGYHVELDLREKRFVILPGGEAELFPSLVEIEASQEMFMPEGSTAQQWFYPDGSSNGGTVRLTTTGRSASITTERITGRIIVNED